MELSIKNISKTYPGSIRALDSVNLQIGTGMHGLLGPNGAGKSTLMRILATLMLPDTGTISFSGIDLVNHPEQIRPRLGYQPQEFGLYDDLTAEQMLHHLAILKGVTHRKTRRAMVHDLLHQTNLHGVRKRKLGAFSGGMRRRFGIAQALINNPDLLIVDEPTAGLDPEERHRFHNILSEAATSRIVLLSTHIVEDISVLCPALTILNKGQVIFHGCLEDALAPMKNSLWEGAAETSEPVSGQIIQRYHRAGIPLVRILSNQPPGDHFKKVAPNLEDAYFHLLNNQPVHIETEASMEPIHVC